MPLYEFLCNACQKRFETSQTVKEHTSALVACPFCGSDHQVEPVLSRFFAVTGRKT